jgi:hypothetical protein
MGGMGASDSERVALWRGRLGEAVQSYATSNGNDACLSTLHIAESGLRSAQESDVRRSLKGLPAEGRNAIARRLSADRLFLLLHLSDAPGAASYYRFEKAVTPIVARYGIDLTAGAYAHRRLGLSVLFELKRRWIEEDPIARKQVKAALPALEAELPRLQGLARLATASGDFRGHFLADIYDARANVLRESIAWVKQL